MSEDIQHTTIGTRGSDLALVQAAAVERSLTLAFPELRLSRQVIRTTGDRRTDVALAEVAKAEGTDKGIFTKELEEALRAGQIDIAVHSLKDVPTVIDEDFEIAGVLPRAPIRDVDGVDALGDDRLAEDHHRHDRHHGGHRGEGGLRFARGRRDRRRGDRA